MDGRSALIGREAESALLAQAVDRARTGTGALVLFCGEAGVGKTRLAQEAAGPAPAAGRARPPEEAAAASAAVVLRGAASNSTATAYGPVVAALRSWLRAR